MKKTTVTRLSTKQKFENYRIALRSLVNSLMYPKKQSAFSLSGYSVLGDKKTPNSISVPELLAVVCTAQKLGKKIQIEITGSGDGGRIEFFFVDSNPTLPAGLL